MFRRLGRNIAITGFAYSIVSLIGLLIAPFLISVYGLGGYGQILLARLFLPSASFGFLDLGIGETATRTVAASVESKDWEHAGRTLTLVAVMALLVSGAGALIVTALAWQLPLWFSIERSESYGFTAILLVTAALLPCLFLSLIVEGILKGFQRFSQVRTIEVVSSLLYAGLAVGAGLSGLGPNWVAAALLISLSIRFLWMSVGAWSALRAHKVPLRRARRGSSGEVIGWSRLMFSNKVLGTIQTQVAAPLIGFMVGPAAVGAFDAVVRLPRFAKSILGLLSLTVLPVATGLKTSGDVGSLRRLGSVGTLAAMILSAPPLVFAAAYSDMILLYWIGSAAVPFWGWQAAMFSIPLFSAAISFGASMLLSDREASAAMNRLTLVQVVLQLLLSIALVPVLDQWAFALGQVASVTLLFPFQLRKVILSLDLDRRLPLRLAALVGISGLIATAAKLAVPTPSFPLLLLLSGIYLAVILIAATFAILDKGERAAAFEQLRRLAKRH